MKNPKYLLGSVVMASTMLISSCGTLIYPERQGQTSGRVDPSVAILNGIGILFFVIPGLLAFAVDFHTGAIYLPNSSLGTNLDKENPNLENTQNYEKIGILNRFSEDELEAIIEQQTGIKNVLEHSKLMVIDTNIEKPLHYERFAQFHINE